MDIKLQDSLAESLRWRCKESANNIAIKFFRQAANIRST